VRVGAEAGGFCVKRRLLILVTLISLLLCVTTVTLWARRVLDNNSWLSLDEAVVEWRGGPYLCLTSEYRFDGSQPREFELDYRWGSPQTGCAYRFWRADSALADTPIMRQSADGTWWYRIPDATLGEAFCPLSGPRDYARFHVPPGIRSYCRSVRVPYSRATMLTGIVPGAVFTSWLVRSIRRRVRVRRGACVDCGFDLRASPERCPECGAEAKAPVAA
jgi:hypothetical protein